MNFLKPIFALLFNRAFTGAIVDFSRNQAQYVVGSKGKPIAIAIDEPGFEYEAGETLGLRIWGSRKNKVYHSEDFTNWNANNITVKTDAVTASDGNLADELVESSKASIAPDLQNSVNVEAGKKYCYWADVAIGDTSLAVRSLRISVAGNTGSGNAFFNIADGSVLSGSNAGIIDLGGGYYRCYRWVEAAGTGSGAFYLGIAKGSSSVINGNDTSSIYISKSGVNEGVFPSPYKKTISTLSSTVADSATVNDLSQLAAGKGAFFVKCKRVGSGVISSLFRIKNDVGDNYIEVYRGADDLVHCVVHDGGVEQTDVTIEDSSDNINVVVSYEDNDVRMSVNGSAVVSDSDVSIPTDFTSILLGRNGTYYLNGILSEFASFTEPLGDSEMMIYSRKMVL